MEMAIKVHIVALALMTFGFVACSTSNEPQSSKERSMQPESSIQANLSDSFVNGRIVRTANGNGYLKIMTIGTLEVPSGSIVACDPLVSFDARPFAQPVPRGTYPVVLSIVKLNEDERVAYAKLLISNAPTTTWNPALLTEQNTKKSEPEFGYVVDTGTGSFMDAKAASMLLKMLEDEVFENNDTYSSLIVKEMEKSRVPTWAWANLKLDEAEGNLITFSSGWGDGRYPSYFGFDEQGNVTELITDFRVLSQ